MLKRSSLPVYAIALLVGMNTAFAGTEVIRTNDALKSFNDDYLKQKEHKAFAQSPTGAWAWRSERTTRAFAIEDAINACNGYQQPTDPPCVLIHADQDWVKP